MRRLVLALAATTAFSGSALAQNATGSGVLIGTAAGTAYDGAAGAAAAVLAGGATQAAGKNTFTGLNIFAKALASAASDQAAEVVNEAIVGSGVNGPATSQQGFYIDVQKAGWYAGTAQPGQIEGLRINNRQGGGTSSANADTSGITINTQARDDNVGFTNNQENVVTLLHHVAGATDTIPRSIDTQVGIINVPTGFYGGFVATSQIGANTDGIRLQSNSGATWTNFLNGILASGTSAVTISGTDGSYLTPTGSITATAGTVTAAKVVSTGAMTTVGFTNTGALANTGTLTNTGAVISTGNVKTAGGITLGGDTTNGSIDIGLGLASTATPYLNFDGFGVTSDARIINDADGQLSFQSKGTQELIQTGTFLLERQSFIAARGIIATTGNSIPAYSTTDALDVYGAATFTTTLSTGSLDAITPATITAPASGTAPTGATQFTKHVSRVTTCSTTQPMQLPAGAAVGSSIDYVLMNRSGGACTVYPVSGGQVENGGANVPISIASGADVVFRSMSPTTWYQ